MGEERSIRSLQRSPRDHRSVAEIWGNRGGIARNPDNEVNGGIVGAKLETRNNGEEDGGG